MLANQGFELGERELRQLAVSIPEGKDQHISLWTARLILTLAAQALLIMHLNTYPALLVVFISTPRYSPPDNSSRSDINGPRMTMTMTMEMDVGSNNGSTDASSDASVHTPPGYHPYGPFTFTGGLGFKPRDIAAVLAMRGLVAMLLQLLFFPKLRDMFGTVRLYRYALIVFPATYFLTPYLATVTSSTPPPLPAAGVRLWALLSALLVVQSTVRSMATPAGMMLLNAACVDHSVLGTVNGIGQSVSAAGRIVGQLLLAGWLYGVGLESGVVGAAWWAMACVAMLAALVAYHVP